MTDNGTISRIRGYLRLGLEDSVTIESDLIAVLQDLHSQQEDLVWRLAEAHSGVPTTEERYGSSSIDSSSSSIDALEEQARRLDGTLLDLGNSWLSVLQRYREGSPVYSSQLYQCHTSIGDTCSKRGHHDMGYVQHGRDETIARMVDAQELQDHATVPSSVTPSGTSILSAHLRSAEVAGSIKESTAGRRAPVVDVGIDAARLSRRSSRNEQLEGLEYMDSAPAIIEDLPSSKECYRRSALEGPAPSRSGEAVSSAEGVVRSEQGAEGEDSNLSSSQRAARDAVMKGRRDELKRFNARLRMEISQLTDGSREDRLHNGVKPMGSAYDKINSVRQYRVGISKIRGLMDDIAASVARDTTPLRDMFSHE
ncbi:hypothetical protein FOZ62_017029 [Perkinsus olseni]|uniref:Uncharacterized protein n=1 Tax=Perkinsus olseni TaxID=32597 RepID=A0A7J6T9C3_PEROL|nr:hypothetical protein FOZ62_017029 [Perkinsus olseni]